MSKLHIAKRLEKFPEYIFAKLGKQVAAIEKEQNCKVLNFGPGTPDVKPSQIYMNKLAEFISDPRAHLYPGYGAIPELSESLTAWYKKRFGVVVGSDMILPLLGGKDGVSHIPLALADPGDEILVPNPGYPAYIGPSLLFDAKPIPYDLNEANNFKLSLKEIESKLSPRTAFIWVNYPSNPTGQVATIEELADLVSFAKKHNLIIVYDNAYSEITFDGYVAPSILQIDGAEDVAVEIGSFSKMSSLAGYRMGWIVGNKEIIAALGKVKSQLDSGLTIPLQRLGAHVLSHPDVKWQEEMIISYKNRRNIIAEKLEKLGLTFTLPEGALYIWAKIPDSASNSVDYCEEILASRHVLFTPGSAFGSLGDRYIRVSICINIDSIEEYL
jgi:LL-diaminopimelate aminotransferase